MFARKTNKKQTKNKHSSTCEVSCENKVDCGRFVEHWEHWYFVVVVELYTMKFLYKLWQKWDFFTKRIQKCINLFLNLRFDDDK